MAARPQPPARRRAADRAARSRTGRRGARGRPGLRRRVLRLSDAFAPLVAGLAPRRVDGQFWHQGATRYGLLSVADPAVSDGRYHRRGGPGVWYASSQEQAAWAELFRHVLDAEIDPFEVRRRIGKVAVAGLEVLDLTARDVTAALGVDHEDLVGDDYSTCRALAEAAQGAGLGGLLAPSAALAGRTTLAVFRAGMDRVVELTSEIRQPPPRLVALRHLIRPVAGAGGG